MADRAEGSWRVAVSGVGAVSGLGWGIDALWAGLVAGRAAIGDFGRFDHARHRTHVAAEVPEPDPALAKTLSGRRLSLADKFALAAAAEALAQAELPSLAGLSVGLYFGSSTGGMWEGEAFFADLLAGEPHLRASLLATQQPNGPGDAVARRFGIEGPVETVSSACASGALALGAALEAIRSGEVEIAIAGGADSLCQITYAGFNSLRSVDERPCRPFRAGREGLSIGEGAAVLILESERRALARGVKPLAFLAGAGASCDAHHMTAPEPQGIGAAAAIRAALSDAGLTPESIAFVNAHGTGTPLNDAAEWRAFEHALGDRARAIPVTSTKGLVGHLLGSSGAIEAVATVLCLARGQVHPSSCGGEVDPELGIDLVLDAPRPLPPFAPDGATISTLAALSTSLAFGGANAALVFTRAEV
ncbi:MAG TPA: beta-ketoacyl-[acyl-carrier-protein] synthase family protein [Thermoanaerobaculia bacterium]|jgi:3-oxoacyl-[acyl-carrier-protein] synthase II|nr:beta-ketoacyl-[acyl-carrier-protein] synthase family protein [Thermoanaerobaculia bacterium]